MRAEGRRGAGKDPGLQAQFYYFSSMTLGKFIYFSEPESLSHNMGSTVLILCVTVRWPGVHASSVPSSNRRHEGLLIREK